MSAITEVYDGLLSILSTVYPSHKKLVNPDEIEANNVLELNRGYALKVGPAEAVNLTTGRYQQYRRTFTVTHTISHKGTFRDASIREAAEKTLLEDQFLLVDYLRLNTDPITKAWDIAWQGDGGIEAVFADKEIYVMIKSTLTVLYAEGC